MEKISFEMIVSAIFNLGFDKVDPVLFTYTLGKISMEDKEHQFLYEEQDTSIWFNKYVDWSSGVIKIRDGYTLDTNVSPNNSMVIPVIKTFFGNKKLLAYLENFDFNEVVLKKAEAYGITNADEAPLDFFSEKEINILRTFQVGKNSKTKKLGLVK